MSNMAVSRMEGGAGGLGGDHEAVAAMENKYRSMYESQTNPFTQFSQMERQRKYAELSVAEKITLNTTRMFLSTKGSRTFVFFYMVTLHLLMFVTTFHWAHETCDREPVK